MAFRRELMAGVWLIAALLCFMIKLQYPPAWWAIGIGVIATILSALYFLCSILRTDYDDDEDGEVIDDDDGSKFVAGEEDEQSEDDVSP